MLKVEVLLVIAKKRQQMGLEMEKRNFTPRPV